MRSQEGGLAGGRALGAGSPRTPGWDSESSGPRPRGPHDGTPSSQPQGLCLSLRPLTPGLPPECDAVCTGTVLICEKLQLELRVS